jgi:ATP synthase subunit 6
MFMPTGAPLLLSPLLVAIEIVSNISRPIALGMRLAANLTAGHILLAILSDFGCKLLFYSWGFAGLFPIFIIIFMTLLEIAVLFIQAYVFTLLSLIYLRDSLILH